MSLELWQSVPLENYSEFYQVSNLGRVRSLDRVVIETTGKKRIKRGKLITPKKSGKYLAVTLFNHPHADRVYIHRLIAITFIPNPLSKPWVNHKNKDRYDNRASNLEWVTPSENTQHMFITAPLPKKNAPKGTECHASKLKESEIIEIRNSWLPGQTTEYSRRYGITYRAMHRIIIGDTWRHISPSAALNWPRDVSN